MRLNERAFLLTIYFAGRMYLRDSRRDRELLGVYNREHYARLVRSNMRLVTSTPRGAQLVQGRFIALGLRSVCRRQSQRKKAQPLVFVDEHALPHASRAGQ